MEKKQNYPDRKAPKSSQTLSVRVEPELAREFQALKLESKFDVPEAQRIALRELAQRLRLEVSKK